ncbi:MAG: 5' nucleotidase, NT5C type [Nanobdellota archaeon]
MNLGIDFDGVIADTVSLKIDYVKERYGKSISPEDTDKKKLSSIIGTAEYEEMIDDIYISEKIMLTAPVVKSAGESIKKLRENHYIFIITNRKDHEINVMTRYLEYNNISYDRIISSAGKSKEKACMENNIRIMLEDSPYQLERFSNKGTRLYLLLRPYNKDIRTHENVIRIDSWDDFIQDVMSKGDR